MNHRPLMVIILTFFISFCNRTPYPGYSRITADLYLNLYELGDSNTKLNPGNYITTNLRYRKIDDSIFFEGIRKFRLEESKYAGSFSRAIQMLSEGDSAGFIINTENFFQKTLDRNVPEFLAHDEMMKIGVRVLSVQTNSEFQSEKTLFLSWVKEFESSEYQIIQKYLETQKLDITPDPGGVFFLSHNKGRGPFVEEGKRVWIHYEGKFLNGQFFDSSREREAPLDFIYGQELVILEGLDYALGKMREGGEALVLLPSDLAFGEKGSAGGIVPPYSTLIYKLEVIKVE